MAPRHAPAGMGGEADELELNARLGKEGGSTACWLCTGTVTPQ
jgi:hypothetical protein